MRRVFFVFLVGFAVATGGKRKRLSQTELCVKAAQQLVDRIAPMSQEVTKRAVRQLTRFSSLPSLTNCDYAVCAISLTLANMHLLTLTRGYHMHGDKSTREVLAAGLSALSNIETGITIACPVTPSEVRRITSMSKWRPIVPTIRSITAEIVSADRRQKKLIAALPAGATTRKSLMAKLDKLPMCQLELLQASAIAARVPRSDALNELLINFVEATSECSSDDEERIDRLAPHLKNVTPENMQRVIAAVRRVSLGLESPRKSTEH